MLWSNRSHWSHQLEISRSSGSRTMLTFKVPATPCAIVGDLAGRVLRRCRFFGGFVTFLQETEHLEAGRARRVLCPTQLSSQSWPSLIGVHRLWICIQSSAFSASSCTRDKRSELLLWGLCWGKKDRLTSVPRNQAVPLRVNYSADSCMASSQLSDDQRRSNSSVEYASLVQLEHQEE